MGTHRDGLVVGGGALLALVLWQADLSWRGALVALALFGAFVVAINRLAGPPPTDAPAEDPDAIDLRVPGVEPVGSAPERLANHP